MNEQSFCFVSHKTNTLCDDAKLIYDYDVRISDNNRLFFFLFCLIGKAPAICCAVHLSSIAAVRQCDSLVMPSFSIEWLEQKFIENTVEIHNVQ